MKKLITTRTVRIVNAEYNKITTVETTYFLGIKIWQKTSFQGCELITNEFLKA